jgi:polyhydroxyalkanoate synthesis regulator phasin
MTINKLDLLIQTALPTVYQQGMSFYEVLSLVTQKVNEQTDALNEYLSTDISTVVEARLHEWLEDGTFDTLISNILTTDLDQAEADIDALEKAVADLQNEVGNTARLAWYNVKYYGAEGDGITDDTAAIQDAVTALTANGGGVLYFPAGIYLNSATHEFNAVDVTVAGQNATIKATALYSDLFNFSGCENPQVTGLTINHDYKATQFLNFYDCLRPVVKNCIFKNAYVNMEDLTNKSCIRLMYSPGAIIDGCMAVNFGESMGSSTAPGPQYRFVSANSGSGTLKVNRCTVDKCRQFIVAGEFNYWRNGSDYTVGTNVLRDNGGIITLYECIFAAGSGTNGPPNSAYWSVVMAVIKPTEQLIVTDNDVSNIAANGIYMVMFGHCIMTGNKFTNVTQSIIVKFDAIISNNHFINCRSVCRVHQSGCHYLQFTDNKIEADVCRIVIDYRSLEVEWYIPEQIIITGNIVHFKAWENAVPYYIGDVKQLIFKDNITITVQDDYNPLLALKRDFDTALVSGNIFKAEPSTSYYYPILRDGSGLLRDFNNVYIGAHRLNGQSNVQRQYTSQAVGTVTAGTSWTSGDLSFYNCELTDMIMATLAGGNKGCLVQAYAVDTNLIRVTVFNPTAGDITIGTVTIKTALIVDVRHV